MFPGASLQECLRVVGRGSWVALAVGPAVGGFRGASARFRYVAAGDSDKEGRGV